MTRAGINVFSLMDLQGCQGTPACLATPAANDTRA